MKSKQELVSSLISNISQRTSRPKYRTGIDSLDNLTWGLHRKELTVIGARPSHGKTSLAVNMAWGLAKNGASVIYLSLEMSVESIIERIMCIEFELHGWKLRTGEAGEIEKCKSLEDKFLSRLMTSPIEIFDDKGRTIQSVEQVLKDMRPEILFIDYVQKISSVGVSKYEAISNYVVTLQSLAIQYDCAIVLNSQINRGGSKKEDATDFMKGSGEIEESADTLLQCQWLFRDDQDREDKREFIIKAVKQRHGPCTYCVVDFDAATFKFHERSLLDIIK